jgi:hypothetical protein
MKKIEKLEGACELPTVKWKVNEIIDYLNQSQKEPEEKLKEEDMLRWLRNGGVLKVESEKKDEWRKRLEDILESNSWEEEVYDGDDYSMVEYFDKEMIIKELIEFISQLLQEGTFSKEELELILYNINYNEGDEVTYLADEKKLSKLKSKISKLLKEKNEDTGYSKKDRKSVKSRI